MCIITDKIEQACGFLLLNEFNSFIYWCKYCQHEFECASDLELHILSEHHDNKTNILKDETEFESFCENQDDSSIDIDIGNVKIDVANQSTDNDQQFELSQSEENNFENTSSDNVNDPLSNDNGIDDKNDEISIENQPALNDGDSSQKKCTVQSNGLEVKKRKRRKAQKELLRKSRRSGPCYCDMCNNKKFKNKECLWNHMKLHLKRQVFDSTVLRPSAGRKTSGPLYCELCPGDEFKYKSILREHMKIHIRSPLGKYCTICKSRVHNYDNHMERVHPPKPFKCHICGADLNTYKGFKLHMQVHTGVKEYLCTYCGKAFSSPNAWRKHESQVHKKDKKYPCPQCTDRVFYGRSHLKQHLNFYHSTERPFKCEICGKDFKTAICLRSHKFSHEDATFQCRYCEKVFRRRENRRKHERNVHKIP